MRLKVKNCLRINKKIKKLRKKGFSLREIVKKVPVSYSTIKRKCKTLRMSISKEGKRSADLKSLKVIKQLSRLHNKFGMKHNICQYDCKGPAYKLYLSKTKDNYERFLNLELFSKAKVTKGYFRGEEKN